MKKKKEKKNICSSCETSADAHRAREIILEDLKRLRKSFERIPKDLSERATMVHLGQEIAANAVASGLLIQQTADIFVLRLKNYINALQNNPNAVVPKEVLVSCEALENAACF